jgi:hypothetical protein
MPCRLCQMNGHNMRTCHLNEHHNFIPVERWFETEEEDPDAGFDEFINPALNFESHLIKSLEEEVAREQRECIICYEMVVNEKVSIKCGHTYCVGCFVKHMRLSNECAYCRTELCEAPQNKRRMTADTRTGLIERAFDFDYLHQTLRSDFIRQMRESIARRIPRVNTRTDTLAMELCAKAVVSVDMTFASWFVGLHTSNYISEWYES